MQSQQYGWSLFVFIVVGISDALDGYIAKRFNAQTQLGLLLDPIADKCLFVANYVVLSLLAIIPFWLMVVVVFRDIVIVSGYLLLVLFFNQVEIKPLWVSKINTAVQLLYIALILSALTWVLNIELLLTILSYFVLITSFISGVAYVLIGAVNATTESEKKERSK